MKKKITTTTKKKPVSKKKESTIVNNYDSSNPFNIIVQGTYLFGKYNNKTVFSKI